MPSLIIGIGNEHRGDDAVGLLAARALRATAAPPHCDIRESAGEGAQLMAQWAGYDHVVLIDAVVGRGAPGTIHRIDAIRETVASGLFRYSTHAFSVAEAIELARALAALPPRLVILGITGVDFSRGSPLSDAVEQSLARCITLARAELDKHPTNEQPTNEYPAR